MCVLCGLPTKYDGLSIILNISGGEILPNTNSFKPGLVVLKLLSDLSFVHLEDTNRTFDSKVTTGSVLRSSTQCRHSNDLTTHGISPSRPMIHFIPF